jgi:hypothetical protein
MTQQARVLQAIRNGAETVADIEVDLHFEFSRHHIAGHVANLKKAGQIRVTGKVHIGRGGTAYRYGVTEPKQVAS